MRGGRSDRPRPNLTPAWDARARSSILRLEDNCDPNPVSGACMDLGLKGKHVLVTGGSKGIGLACARAFMAEGARVAIVSRSRENLEAAKKSLGEVYTIAADLTDAAAAAAMVERVEKEFGALDVLVNSAGAAKRTDAEDLTSA